MVKSERNQAFLKLAEEIAEQMVEISKKIDCLTELLKPAYSSDHND